MTPVDVAAIAGDPGAAAPEARYERLRRLIVRDRCVLLDGAVGTELIEHGGQRPEVEEHLWGLTAILDSPAEVRAVHRRYAELGCDAITTNTWGLPTALRSGSLAAADSAEPVHWMDVARRAVRLARSGAHDAGRDDQVAVAFSINGDVDTPDGRRDDPAPRPGVRPGPPGSDPARDAVAGSQLDLRHGRGAARHRPTGVAELPPLPPRRLRRLRRALGRPRGGRLRPGRPALRGDGRRRAAINCIPPDHVTGTLSWLRDFTDLVAYLLEVTRKR